jgi:hypothetical protein
MKKLLEVKKQIGTLSKNSKNPFFKSKYLDLTSLLEAVEPVLIENGIILLQPLSEGRVVTLLIDADDGSTIVESEISIPENITDPQKLGSAITYFRRYTLKSLLAIAEDDDDGNLAAKKTKPSLSDDKLKGCEDWTDAQKQAVKSKYKLSKEQLNKLA